MAYTISLIGRSGEPVAQRAILQLVEAAVRIDPAITPAPHSDGVGWSAYDIFASRNPEKESKDPLGDLLAPCDGSSSILLQVNTRPDTIKQQVEWALQNGAPDALANGDTLIELTLSGGAPDWATVHTICSAAVRLWNAQPCDEESGLAVSPDEPA